MSEIKTWQERIAERHGSDDPGFKLFGDRYYMAAEIAECRARILEQEKVIDAARKLVAAKGRYHTELNYKELTDAILAHKETPA